MTATDHRLRLFQKQLASQGASTDETSIEGETRATLVCCVRFTKSCDSGFSRNALGSELVQAHRPKGQRLSQAQRAFHEITHNTACSVSLDLDELARWLEIGGAICPAQPPKNLAAKRGRVTVQAASKRAMSMSAAKDRRSRSAWYSAE